MRPLRALGFVLLALLLATGCSTLKVKEDSSPVTVVENYLSALNRRDLMVLTAYVEPNVTWYSVVKGERIQEVVGREALKETLRSYFAQNEKTEWRIEQVTTTDQTVAVRERSVWQSKSDHGARISLAVYEISGGRITRITHYLAER